MADFVIVLVSVLVAGLILGKIGSHFGAAHGREKEGFWLGFAFGPLGRDHGLPAAGEREVLPQMPQTHPSEGDYLPVLPKRES